MAEEFPLSRRLAAEGMGTAFLLMSVVGSGIMGQRLSAENDALALLANSIATGCALGVLILIFLPVSGAHFNPAVTLCMALQKQMCKRAAVLYIAVQSLAAVIGVGAANLMFGEPVFSVSQKIRTGWAQWGSEFVATFGLLLVIFACVRRKISALPFAVAAYITAAYWFTGSTSFANPAVTLARGFSDSFAGIRPVDTGGFILAQIAGTLAAAGFAGWLYIGKEDAGEDGGR